MLAFELSVPITNHHLVIQDDALPANARSASVIVMWELNKPSARRFQSLALAGKGIEAGDIINSTPASDWNSLL